MNNLYKFLFVSVLCGSTYAGEPVWAELKALDTQQQTTGTVSYIGTVDSDDLKSITTGAASPEFVLVENIVIFENTGEISKAADRPWNGRKFFAGSVYLRTSNLINIGIINKELVSELKRITSK